jgi:hypothetical protein
MKVLTTMFYFLLPEDFAGGKAEALRVLAEYVDETDRSSQVEYGETSITLPDEIWQGFVGGLRRGKRMCGVLAINDVPTAVPTETKK